MTLAFYTRYALRALARGGQRTLLAVLCVAFGVMSLVSMQLLAGLIHGSVVGDPRALIGGDAALHPGEGQVVTEAQLAGLDRLRAAGSLGNYTPIAPLFAAMLKPAGTGQVYFLTRGARGVDPATYPLVGSIPLRAPANTSFAAAIGQPLGAVITRDLADSLGFHVGDRFTLIGDADTLLPQLQVTGIAQDVPNRQGDGIYYSLDTARTLTGRSQVAGQVAVTWGPAGAPPLAPLQADGWGVETAADLAANGIGRAATVFDFMLKAAGILGLVVGGIGVANTLQVLLARRTLEIAALKTLGYRRRDLLALFGVETALLGLAGGLVGAVVGVALAAGLVNLLGATGLFLLSWAVDPTIVAGGVATGVLTAVIFGLYTIVRASSVRPSVLLRNLPARGTWGTRLAGFALLLGLLVLFSAISAVVMGSPLAGAEVIGGGLAGLLALMILLGGTLFVLLRLPVPHVPLLVLARQNLKRQPLRAVFPLVALFMGIFTIGFATGTLVDAFQRVASQQKSAGGYNLVVYGRPSTAEATRQALVGAGVGTIHTALHIPAQVQTRAGAPLPGVSFLDGRTPADATWDVQATGGAWPGAEDAVLVPARAATVAGLAPGDLLAVVPAGGVTTTVRVAGFYTPQGGDALDLPGKASGGLLVSQALAARLGGAGGSTVFAGTLPVAQLEPVATALGRALPEAIIVSKADLNNSLGRRYASLLTFVDGVAALALVAGTILIANAVGLALIERRRELGILKAVGFTAGRVLRMLALENALLGLLAGGFGVIAVAVAMAIINVLRPAAQLSLDPGVGLALLAVAVLLTLGTTALVAWQPTRARPLDVLRNE